MSLILGLALLPLVSGMALLPLIVASILAISLAWIHVWSYDWETCHGDIALLALICSGGLLSLICSLRLKDLGTGGGRIGTLMSLAILLPLIGVMAA